MRIQSSGVPGPGAVELVLAEECSHSHGPDEILHLQGVTMTQIRFVVPVFCLGLMMFATQVPQVRAQQNETLTGEWEVTSVELGIRSTVRLQLTESGNVLNGKLYNDGEHIEVKGTVNGPQVRLEAKAGDQSSVYQGTLANGGLSGTFTVTGQDNTRTGTWTAKRAAMGKPTAPRTLEYVPTDFHRQLSADIPPAMKIWPGDVVRAKSVDAGGQDEKNVQRVAGGNPLTGPFYIEGTMPGAVVAVKIRRLHINRDWAVSDSVLVGRALTNSYASQNKQEWKPVRWHLDADKQVATLRTPPNT